MAAEAVAPVRKYEAEAAARQIDRTKYMTRREAARFLGVPFERIAPMVARGGLKGTWRGHWLYIERASAEEFKRRAQR